MIKVKTALIGAAALVSVALPGVAVAGKLGEAFKYQREKLHDLRDQKHDIREQYQNGEITKEEKKTQTQDIVAQVDDVQDTLDEYKASR